MKTFGFLAFVLIGFFGSIVFIYYMWKPFLMSDPESTIIAGDTAQHEEVSPTSIPSATPPIVPLEAVSVSPTVFYGPDGIVYHRY